jgi:hypothetical protein
MERKNFGIAGILVVLLAMGLALAGCDNGTTDKGEYHLAWGAASVAYSYVSSQIADSAQERGADWLLCTGSTATTVYDNAREQISSWLLANGDFDGSFNECLNFSNEGIEAPSGLKGSSSAVASGVPLLGVFDGGSMTVLFYITKN